MAGGRAMSDELRRAIYSVLIAIATATMFARVARVDSPDPKSPTPFLSANDRSRWATIRALGDEGTYAIDDIVFDQQGRRVRGWHSIDMVRHRGTDGKEHYYSSKPTLLTTLLAGEYWLIKRVTGATLAEQPHYVAKLMLILTNVLPLAAGLWLLARLIDRLGSSDWGRIFAVAAACFATFLTTFAVTLNNHTIAALSLIGGLAAALPILNGNCSAWWRFAVSGLALGFLAANELPALSFLVFAGAALALKSPLKTLAAYLPAAILIGVAAIGTNYLAHGDWRTAYAHKDWYAYPGSYWLPENLRGVDVGESSPLVYAFNCLIGHHGLFSLTPIWLLSAIGCVMGLLNSKDRSLLRSPGCEQAQAATEPTTYASTHHSRLTTHRQLSILTISTSLVVLGFYLSQPQITRNYGGGTCCLRWLIWLTPLWLLTLLPAADKLAGCRYGRAIGLALLAISVFSAVYAADNPWSHPWIFDYWTAMGWIDYGGN
jgi:hypothetical protein